MAAYRVRKQFNEEYMNDKPRPIAIGVVYGKDGAPKLDPDFLAHLHPQQRAVVAQNLFEHGYRLTDENSVEKL